MKQLLLILAYSAGITSVLAIALSIGCNNPLMFAMGFCCCLLSGLLYAAYDWWYKAPVEE